MYYIVADLYISEDATETYFLGTQNYPDKNMYGVYIWENEITENTLKFMTLSGAEIYKEYHKNHLPNNSCMYENLRIINIGDKEL